MVDEDLQIVHAPEARLCPLEDTQAVAVRTCGGLRGKLHRISQLLERNPDGVEALGEVDGRGGFDRLSERGRPTCDSRVERPSPGAVPPLTEFSLFEILQHPGELASGLPCL